MHAYVPNELHAHFHNMPFLFYRFFVFLMLFHMDCATVKADPSFAEPRKVSHKKMHSCLIWAHHQPNTNSPNTMLLTRGCCCVFFCRAQLQTALHRIACIFHRCNFILCKMPDII